MVTGRSNESPLVQWPTVRVEELKEIDRRRLAAGLMTAESNKPDTTKDGDAVPSAGAEDAAESVVSQSPDLNDERCRSHAENLVGLAFSGGGIRSASFNLGLLQALHEKGVLRHVDLLSTVSGGGYIGSHLSSLALREETSMERGRFPLQEEPGGKQPVRVLQFLRNGRYMVAQPLRFAGAYIVGTLLNNVVVMSGLLMVCTFIAFVWRFFDMPWVHDTVKQLTLGHATDYHRPFIPAAAFFAMWLVFRIYDAYAAKGRSIVPTVFFAMGCSSILIGVALLLGNGDISGLGLDRTQFGSVVFGFLLLLVLGLIPTLRPWRLLQSGVNVSKKSDQLLFKMASTALLVGVPLAVIYYVGRENCSGYGTTRTELIPSDIYDWSILGELDSSGDSQPATSSIAMIMGLLGTPAVLPQENLNRLADKPAVDLQEDEFGELKGTLVEQLIAQARIFQKADHKNKVLQWNELYLNTLKSLIQKSRTSDTSGRMQQLLEQLQLRKNEDTLQQELTRKLNQWMNGPQTLQRAANAIASGTIWSQLRNAERQLEQTAGRPRFEREVHDSILAFHRLSEKQKQWMDDLAITLVSKELGVNVPEVSDSDKAEFARLYFEAEYPQMVFNRARILRRTVIVPDQWWRANVLAGSFAVFLISLLCIDPNLTSVHNYYCRQLSQAYIEPVRGFGRNIPVCKLDTVAKGAPYHIINTAINLVGSRHPDSVDATRTFIFTRKYCGSGVTDYCPTGEYLEGGYDLANAMAISGGALSPSQSHSPLIMLLMMALNLRLGQWLPNPRRKAAGKRPTYWQILKDLHLPAEERAFCFLSDGGHRENLGLAPLLRRRCKLIIASDAGYDPEHAFADLLKVYRTARSRYGTRFVDLSSGLPMSLSDLHLEFKRMNESDPNSKCLPGTARKHFLVVGIRYNLPRTIVDGKELPEPTEGILIYIKPSMVGDEEIDLLQHRVENPMFPHDPTSDVAFNEEQFESYRQLGHHIGMNLCADVAGDELWTCNAENRCATLESRLAGYPLNAHEVSIWVEDRDFSPGNFSPALRILASGDDEAVDTISKWAMLSDDVDPSIREEWRLALEMLLDRKSESLSAHARGVIVKLLREFSPPRKRARASKKV